MTRWDRKVAPLALVVAAVLGGCHARISSVPMAPASEGGLDAGLEGRLTVVDDCLVVVDAAQTKWAVVWPSPGTQWLADDQAIEVRGVRVRVGDVVVVGGGTISVTPENLDSHEWVARPSDGCLQQDGFWLASHIAE